MRGANNRTVKSMNRTAALQYIRKQGQASRADIAAYTRLSFTAVKNMIDELVSYRLIGEVGYDESSGGRKPLLYKLKADRFYAIGLHLSVSRIHVAVLDLEGRVHAHYETATDQDKLRSDAIVLQLIGCIEEAIRLSDVDRGLILGIGLAIPGPLDPFEGVVLSPPNMQGLAGVPLKRRIADHFGIAAFIEKDADLIALGEYWHGAARGKQNVFYLDADIGIGSGMIFGGQLHHGSPYGAGEVGHGTIHLDGPRCNCGNYGCLEAVASGIAIERRAGEELRRGADAPYRESYLADEKSVSLYTILEEAGAGNGSGDGDALSKQLLLESARYVGIAVGNVVHLLMPEIVIIGGTLPYAYPPYFEHARDIALNRIFAAFSDKVRIVKAELGMLGGAIGAGTLVLEHFFAKDVSEWADMEPPLQVQQ
ncbi:ROK family protein [Paenibacillus silvisoli]|uniref:ROK family protein n=1 Tax=Paenibacillus silvisoli TaxID=3110539 RepID=UPI002805DE57|nr:ROK family protein [Paenibacillus silvisoli]